MRYWNEQEISILKRCWKKGLSGSKISALLKDRSRQSVLIKARRLNLDRRGPSTNKKVTL